MKRVLETCLYGTDLDAMEAFYGGLLGFEKQSREGDRHVFFRLDDGMLLIFNPNETVKPPPPQAFPVPTHGASGRGHVCFGAEADALDDLRRMFEDAGIAIDADFRWPNGARSVYIRDPAGNSVEFAEPRLWGF